MTCFDQNKELILHVGSSKDNLGAVLIYIAQKSMPQELL